MSFGGPPLSFSTLNVGGQGVGGGKQKKHHQFTNASFSSGASFFPSTDCTFPSTDGTFSLVAIAHCRGCSVQPRKIGRALVRQPNAVPGTVPSTVPGTVPSTVPGRFFSAGSRIHAYLRYSITNSTKKHERGARPKKIGRAPCWAPCRAPCWAPRWAPCGHRVGHRAGLPNMVPDRFFSVGRRAAKYFRYGELEASPACPATRHSWGRTRPLRGTGC